MKNFLILLFSAVLFYDCNVVTNETIKGNGNTKTDERNVDVTGKIKSLGFFNVEIIQGSPSGVKVEADENLLPYIITESKDGWLTIRSKDNVNLRSTNPVKVYVKTNALSDIEVAGSGDINSTGKFTGESHLKLSIAGSGNINLNVNTPDVDANIAGSGNINISGETKTSSVSIAGKGDFKAEDLKSESADVKIMGTGNVRVYASETLNVKIMGSGNVYYKRQPFYK